MKWSDYCCCCICCWLSDLSRLDLLAAACVMAESQPRTYFHEGWSAIPEANHPSQDRHSPWLSRLISTLSHDKPCNATGTCSTATVGLCPCALMRLTLTGLICRIFWIDGDGEAHIPGSSYNDWGRLQRPIELNNYFWQNLALFNPIVILIIIF